MDDCFRRALLQANTLTRNTAIQLQAEMKLLITSKQTKLEIRFVLASFPFATLKMRNSQATKCISKSRTEGYSSVWKSSTSTSCAPGQDVSAIGGPREEMKDGSNLERRDAPCQNLDSCATDDPLERQNTKKTTAITPLD
ncbi:hypothetical protein R1flu_010385 [Riccia fluitans]|uniref:Uncharacterized protein n=1 Tax=Riccia fluitans TaxID=41844 RepID=A0ABD1Z5Q8_9MARC